MKAESFFSKQDKEMIAKAVKAAETKTSGEIVVMVVDQSDNYVESRIMAGGVIGGLLSLMITDLFLADSLWYFVGLLVVLIPIWAWGVEYLPFIKRLFTSDNKMVEEVKERALAAFYEKGLYKTRDETGVLFFISLFERKVWVLADGGIYKKITPESLQTYALSVAHGIKNGEACEALCREIAKVAEVMAEHFPIKDDDTNELSDEVIID